MFSMFSYTRTHQYWLTSKNSHQLCVDTGCRLENLSSVIANKNRWWDSQGNLCCRHTLMIMSWCFHTTYKMKQTQLSKRWDSQIQCKYFSKIKFVDLIFWATIKTDRKLLVKAFQNIVFEIWTTQKIGHQGCYFFLIVFHNILIKIVIYTSPTFLNQLNPISFIN